jgi:desulfoferrodoxin (superoxide reductase-like protein)
MLNSTSRKVREAGTVGRRGFLGAIGGAAAALSACTVGPLVGRYVNPLWLERTATLKGGKVYTKAAPGIWMGKEGTHVPTVTIDAAKRTATVSCSHGLAEGHWITTLFVEDQDGNVIHLEEFMGRGPSASLASTTFEVPAGVTSVMAYSYCNLHDCWSTESISVG